MSQLLSISSHHHFLPSPFRIPPEDDIFCPFDFEEKHVSNEEHFPSRLYDNIEAFLDNEGLDIIEPEHTLSPIMSRPFIQLKRIPSLSIKRQESSDEEASLTSSSVIKRRLEARKAKSALDSSFDKENQMILNNYALKTRAGSSQF